MDSHEVDRAVARLAATQHGVFAGRQAMAQGATYRLIGRRVANGMWVELDDFTFGFPSHRDSWRRTLMAAVLAESEAVADGRSSARLHEFAGFGEASPEIVVPPGSNHRSRLARVHEREDIRVTTVDGIPTVTAVDTVFSLAAWVARRRLAPGRLRFAVDDAIKRRALTVDELGTRYLGFAGSRRPGLPFVRELLEVRSIDAYVPPTSKLESLLYEVLDRPAMPPHRRQVRLPWSPAEVVDAMLTDAPVIIEADGRRWHTRVADFDRDRYRDRQAALHGYHTLRYTWEDLLQRSGVVVTEIQRMARQLDRSA